MSTSPPISENLMSQALPMADLVGFQAGSVVSRTLINKPVGTVTLFSFDKDQGLSTHSAPYDALVWILEGESEITIEEKKLTAKKGDMVILPANIPHGLNASVPFKMALVMIKEK